MLDLNEVVTLVNRRSTDLRAYITPYTAPPTGSHYDYHRGSYNCETYFNFCKFSSRDNPILQETRHRPLLGSQCLCDCGIDVPW